MLNEYFYNLAKLANETVKLPVGAEVIYSQWVHESTNVDRQSKDYGKPFKSELAVDNKNLGGLTQVEPNDTPQPDGSYYYMNFPSYENYALYFGRYILLYPGVEQAQSIEEYCTVLKDGGYFGDTLGNYIDGVTSAYEEAFSNG